MLFVLEFLVCQGHAIIHKCFFVQGKSSMPEVSFYKNGAVIESGPRRKVYSEGCRHMLRLNYVLIDDGGELN